MFPTCSPKSTLSLQPPHFQSAFFFPFLGSHSQCCMEPLLQFLVRVWVTAAAVMPCMKAVSLLFSRSSLLDLNAVTGQFQTSVLNC